MTVEAGGRLPSGGATPPGRGSRMDKWVGRIIKGFLAGMARSRVPRSRQGTDGHHLADRAGDSRVRSAADRHRSLAPQGMASQIAFFAARELLTRTARTTSAASG